MKTCSKCKITKSLEDFYVDRYATSGRRPQCKNCMGFYSLIHKQQKAKYDKQYRKKNENVIKEQKRLWYQIPKNKLKKLESMRRYNQDPVVKNAYNRWRSTRYKKNIHFRLACLLRTRLNTAVRGCHKSGSAVNDLGCTVGEFKIYMEAHFTSGMTWDNWAKNGWHIDHKLPLACFDLTDRKQLLKACHYTNLQPMWAKENISKGKKLLDSK